MALYEISTRYITSTRGINGGDEMPGMGGETTRKTWPDAAAAFESAVYDCTAANGLCDTRAGHDAAYAAKRATCAPMKKGDHDKVVTISGLRIRLKRIS